MNKVVLIDDEKYIRDKIKLILLEHFDDQIEIVGEAESVDSAILLIEQEQPDLIFLDIELSDGTGFELLTRLKNKSFELIFVTGFDEHAIKAIKVGALDYILKPIDHDELREAVQKILDCHDRTVDLERFIEVSNGFYHGVKKKRIVLKTLENIYTVAEDDILYCKSEGNYTTFYTIQQNKILISKSIKKVVALLSEDIFIRSHQSYLVNREHVLRYNRKGFLVITNDLKVPVSGRLKEVVLDRIFN